MTRAVPTYRSSAALTALAQSIYNVHRDYMAKRTADESRINYTPAGRSEVRTRDAREAFGKLDQLLAKAHRAGDEVVASARQKAMTALNAAAPKLDAASAILAVEVARMFQQDPSQRSRLVNVAEAHALDPADAELAALAIHLPTRLSGLTAAQRDTLRVALVPDEARALYVAKDEADLIARHVGTVASLIAEHSQSWDMSTDLTIAVGAARAAESVGYAEEPPSIEGDAAEQPAEEPTGDTADESHDEPATEEV
jgi:hypothetical protein